MPVQILSTKLSIPAVRARLVLRPRLLQQLNLGLESGLVLVSAPAGYGKSTLLSMWVHRLDIPVAWISLDGRDNDPSRFFAYLTSAVVAIYPSLDPQAVDIAAGINSSLDIENALTGLINALSPAKHPICLILDDFHEIQNQTIHQSIGFLIEHRPAHVHLVIATRADPPLPLAKLRARSCLSELRMNDLRFTVEEASDFLYHTMGLNISPQDVEHLNQRTEGWIAGLQMAGLSMQNSADIPAFIASLSSSQYYIFDYLLEEILQKQSAEIQRFLLYTSVLDQLTGSLCDALLGGESDNPNSRPASIILHELEHANLFIIPLDNEQRWYRYHPLFAELLRASLQKKDPSLVSTLHTRASAWYEAQGLISYAIQHSFTARDWEGVIRLISANIFALLEQKELNSVARQLENLTAENPAARPWLLVGRAWLAAYTGQLGSVEPILIQAEAHIDGLGSEIELQRLGGHIAAIRAYINWIGDRRDIASKAALTALEWLPESESLIRCQAATLLGLTLPVTFDSERAMKQALGYARQGVVSHVTIFAHGCWAFLLILQGKLHEAQAACQEAIRLSRSASAQLPLPTLSHVYATLSIVLREWNDLDGAVHYGKLAVDLARQWEQADALHFALDTLGYALFESGDVEAAKDTLKQAWQVARRTSTWFEDISLAQEIRWHLRQNDPGSAFASMQAAKGEHFDEVILSPQANKTSLLPIYIQLLMAQKEYSEALRLLAELLEKTRQNGQVHWNIRLLILQALVHQALHQVPMALSSLKQALEIGAPQGYVRTFIQDGTEMRTLLLQARSNGIMPDYIDSLLAAFDGAIKALPTKPRLSTTLIESLSSREMDVLKLLAQGCSDKKIAESLVIARETVHKHLKNIYGKLDVHSRTEAVARAHDLNLL